MRAKVDRVLVCLGEKLVGTLVETANHRVAFEYSPEWLATGFTISPFSLQLDNCVFIPEELTFDGLFGVFADSLPDSWGQLLVDRMLQRRGYDPEKVSHLQRLCIVGDIGILMKLTKTICRDNPEDVRQLYLRMCFNVFFS